MVLVPAQRIVRPVAFVLALSSVTVAGCSSTGGPGLFSSYTIAADDGCSAQKQTLKSYRDYFFASMLEGAAIGAGAGALTGYLIGGSPRSALIGAGAGALVGGTVGYYSAKQKANSSPTRLTDSIYSDVSRENAQIDGVTGAFRELRRCRVRSAGEIKRDYAAHRVDQQDAQAKLKKVHDWYVEDIDFADALGAKMGDRGKEYANASDQLMTQEPSSRETLAKRDRNAPPSAGTESGGNRLVAGESARVRENPSTDGRQIGTIPAGAGVSVGDQANVPNDWTRVELADGKTGYVASRLLHPPGAGGKATASAAPPPKDAAGVAQLTESNQLKRKALTTDVAEAKTEASGSSFELSGNISRETPRWLLRWPA